MGNIVAKSYAHKEENKYHERNSGSAVDRISDLPDDILHVILSFLHLKSAGQTTVLSRRWNDLWSSYIIKTVLARRQENCNILYPCLKLSLPRVGVDPNKSCLSRVEELVLHIRLSTGNKSDRPQCQLMCHSLRTSSSCGNSKAWLGFPASYVVGSYLHSLHTLSLTRVDFSESTAIAENLDNISDFDDEKIYPGHGMPVQELSRCPQRHSLSIWFYGFTYTWEKNDMWNNQSLDDANFTQEQYWESQGQILSSFLSHLKEVEIFLGRIMIPESAIVFAKFVLKYGRGLQTIKVRFRKSSSRSSLPPKSLSKTIALIERSPRASADIKFSTTCY
ncbi:hypothetical protein ACLB2K_006466 [Fragaria x ananassa]